jgi:hypothetical protein
MPAAGTPGWPIASRPEGPFRVQRGIRLPFLNGGTAWDGRRFYQAATSSSGAFLYRSDDGRRWSPLAPIPEPGTPAWDLWRSDFSLVRRPHGLDLYYAGRPGPSGADLGLLRYRRGRFRDAGRILERRDELDLGEPALFRVSGRTYMLYGSLPREGAPRQIEFALVTAHGLERCGSLVRPSRRYPGNAIDPEPLVIGDRLYLYFGGGERPSLGGNMRGTVWLRVYRLG